MNEHIGRQVGLGIAVEGSRGTAEANASRWIRVIPSFLPQVEKVIDESSFGRLEESATSRRVKHWYEGEVSGNLHADSIGYFLYNLYGDVDTAEPETGVYEHTFELDNAISHPTLSLFVKDPVKDEVYNGGVVSTLEITANMDEIVTFSANLMAKTSNDSTETVTYEKEYDFVGKDISVKFADTEAGLAGATPVKAKTLTITWDAGSISDFVFGSDTPDNIYNGRFAIGVSLERNYTDQTFEDLFKSDVAKYMQISIEGDEVLPEDERPAIIVTLNKVQVQSWDKSDDLDALSTETVELKAFYNTTDSEQSKVLLRNVTESYTTGS